MLNTAERKRQARLNHRKMLAQQLRTLDREGVLYTDQGPINRAEWLARLREAVKRKCAPPRNPKATGVAESAVVAMVMERDGIGLFEARFRHVGQVSVYTNNMCAMGERVAKWRARAKVGR